MPDGKDSWIQRWSRSEDRMKNARAMIEIAVAVLVIASSWGGIVYTHMSSEARITAEIHKRDLQAKEQHEQLVLELAKVKSHVIWTERSVEDLAKDIPAALELHEARMHPKEYGSTGSPTRFEINLPKKPKAAAGW